MLRRAPDVIPDASNESEETPFCFDYPTLIEGADLDKVRKDIKSRGGDYEESFRF
ncbi:unnamed protein product [Larinioides sclopetarius]|uniref:Uncharacterized protein n=1 Tax=Larinioides sclopetarius TaxID=280406 RepID=A0AAV2AEC4_9ARAC